MPLYRDGSIGSPIDTPMVLSPGGMNAGENRGHFMNRFHAANAPATPDSSKATAVPPVDTLPTSFFPRLTGVCFTAAGIGWAVGERGAAFRSNDRGATWTQIPTGIREDFDSIACNGRLDAIAAGVGGVVHLRAGGRADVRTTTFVGRDIAIGTGDTLWASGVRASLRHSSDTGRTWSVVDSALRAMAFADSLTRFAIDTVGVVNVTENGGRTWARRGRCAPPDTAPARIVAASATVALMVDARGRLSYTNDGWRSCPGALSLDGSTASAAPAISRTFQPAACPGGRSSGLPE